MVSALGAGIMVSIIATIVFIVINSLVLWLVASKIFKYHDETFKTAFMVAVIAGVISFILSLIPMFVTALSAALVINIILFIVNAIVLIYLIKRYYDTTLGQAILTWVIVLVIDLVLGFVVGFLLGLAGLGLIGGAV